MKKIIPILALLALCLPAHCYTSYKTVSFGAGQTGQTVTYSVKDNSGTSVTTGVSGSVLELGGGAYGAAITVPDGANYFVVWSETNSGTTYTASDKIEAQATAAIAGAAALATANTGITTANTGITSNLTAINANNTAIAALPSASANASAVWGAGARTITGGTITINSDKSGYVLFGTQAFANSTASTVTPTWYTPPSNSDTPGTTLLLTRIPGTVQPQSGDAFARLGTPAGTSLAADMAALQASTTANGTALAGIPAAVWAYTASDGLTHQQSDAIKTAILARAFFVNWNASTRTQVTAYYKADGVTPMATTTTVYDAAGRAISRVTVFSNLP